MMNDPNTRDEAIFIGALQLAAEQRTKYLQLACAGDTELEQRVLNWLDAYEKSAGPLEESALPGAGGTIAKLANLRLFVGGAMPPGGGARITSPPGVIAGDKIGPYKILQLIGEGGCGMVYMAEQEQPVRRRVALKVIKLGMDTKQVIARFEAERQALALMDHPNIAKIYDAGVTQATVTTSGSPDTRHPSPVTSAGRPYFIMELVRGIKITEYCDQNNLATKERLELFTQVCHAIQHAHQKGIIHRDIKPSNILVTMHDGKPVPKVIDFGIAKAIDQKLTDKTLFTQFEQFIGTPAYMSPEQAEMTSLDIDTRSDIYSLGVLLYELLTSRTPFDAKELLAAGLDAMRRMIREQDPPRPSTRLSTLLDADLTTVAKRRQAAAPKLIHLIRGDLDWIVMKTLEKDRTRRYDTASGLAMDIERYLSDDTVLARPPSHLYRFGKLVRRNKIAFGAAAAIAASLIFGIGLSTWFYLKEKAARRLADAEAARSQQVALLLEDSLKGVGPAVALGRDTALLREIMDRTVERVAKDLQNQPDVQAELCNTIGEVYRALGASDKAEQMHRKAKSLEGQSAGGRRADASISLNDLALVLYDQGKFPESEALHREVIALRAKKLGRDNTEVAESLSNLGLVLRKESKLSEAESLQREALAIQKKHFGPEHLAVATTLNNLGLVLRDQGKLSEAEGNFRDALAILKKLKGDEDPGVALALDNLAFVLRDEGKPDEAESLERKALALQKKLLPADHPYVATALNNLALVLARRGNLAEAEKTHREALEMRRRLWKDGHAELASSLDNLALLLRSIGAARLIEAEGLEREALTMRRKLLGEENLAVAGSLHNLGLILRDQSKLPEAEISFRDALAMERKLVGNEHPVVATMLERTLDVLLREQKFGEAEALANEILTPSLEAKSGAAGLLRARGAARARASRWQEARADFSKAIDMDPAYRPAYDALAALLAQAKDLEGYRGHCSRSLARFGTTTDPAVAERIVRNCLIMPAPGVDLADVAKLAERANTTAASVKTAAGSRLVMGLVEFRQGRFADASHALETVFISSSQGLREVQISSVFAMAKQMSNDSQQARTALARAAEMAKSSLPKSERTDLGNDWIEHLITQSLLSEATALIAGNGQ